MTAEEKRQEHEIIEQALKVACQTTMLRVDGGLRHEAGGLLPDRFDRQPALIVADANTFEVAGRDVVDSFRAARQPCVEPFVFEQEHLRAEYAHVETIERVLADSDATAIAVGSGTINDLTKLASHNLGRPYAVVATAASMDGYAAFGASIVRNGFKKTIDCRAPVAILADLDVIQAAPPKMSASGYADLLAKNVAGADWLIADALGVDSMDETAWEMIHGRLHEWVGDPEGVRHGDPRALRSLVIGLMLSGFAMQHTRTSRPASGAEHQFSHLWDMQRSRHHAHDPSHGFQVGIGTLASASFYEALLRHNLEDFEVEQGALAWPDISTVEAEIRGRFPRECLARKALEETRAKHLSSAQLRDQLARLRRMGPSLTARLRAHLLPCVETRDRLDAAGCPVESPQIGISRQRLRASYREAYFIRRRFTVLDLAMRSGQFDSTLQLLFPDEV